jgi:hypothetical protein
MTPTTDRVDAIRDTLTIFLAPGQVTELRALQLGTRKALNAFFSTERVGDMARQAIRWEREGAKSVRFIPNPLRPDVADSPRFARNDDVVGRRWLMVDCEGRTHAEDRPASDLEREAAWAVLDRCRGTLDAAGFRGAVVGDSGNYWHLFYPLDLPNDEPSRELVKALLKGLAQRCSDDQAHVDPGTYHAMQLAKVYGTLSRKGVEAPGCPHRFSRLVEGHPPPAGVAEANGTAARRLLDRWKVQDDLRRGPERQPLSAAQREDARLGLYAQSALSGECGKVAGAPPGTRNRQLNDSAFALGTLVGGGMLPRDLAERELMTAARSAGLPEDEARGTVKSGLNAGTLQPRQRPEGNGRWNGHTGNGFSVVLDELASDPSRQRDPAEVATIEDLERAGSQVAWLWEGWIPTGVLTAVAALGGTGKTRFCADLLRRIRHGLPWPDGRAMTLPPESLALWVVSDNHHDEMVTLSRTFGIAESVRINAWKQDPYGGVTLETAEDLADLDARIRAVAPALVIIDTVGNSTDRNLSKQEEAKAYYFPLQILARRHRCAVLCLTHLNAGGGFLGRRVLEKVRVAIRLEQPDPSTEKRRLEVAKSNSKRPLALGLTMSDHGNDYDSDPPSAPQEEGRPLSPTVRKAVEWLRERLTFGAAKVGSVLGDGGNAGHSKGALYRACEELSVERFEDGDGKKWWRLPDQGDLTPAPNAPGF